MNAGALGKIGYISEVTGMWRPGCLPFARNVAFRVTAYSEGGKRVQPVATCRKGRSLKRYGRRGTRVKSTHLPDMILTPWL